MKGIGKVRAQQGAEPFQDVDREGKEGLVPGSTGRVKENGDLPLLRDPRGASSTVTEDSDLRRPGK